MGAKIYYTIISSSCRKSGIGRESNLKLRDYLIAQGFPLDFPLPQVREIWAKWLAEAMPPPVARALIDMLPLERFTMIDVFCGIGGWILGAHQTGKLVKAIGIDIDKRKLKILECACEKYGICAEFVCADIGKLDPSTLPNVDLVVGSPPCQDISLARCIVEYKGIFKPRGTYPLTERFFEIIDAIRPKYWIMENVYNRKYVEFLRELRDDIRFVQKVDFSKWVPQLRKRLIVSNYPLGNQMLDDFL